MLGDKWTAAWGAGLSGFLRTQSYGIMRITLNEGCVLSVFAGTESS